MTEPPELTVLVPVADEVDAAAICADLDAQSLPAERFDVVLVSPDALPERILRWAERRDNVDVAADIETARAAARAPRLLELTPDDRLFAFGLRELADTARDSDADLVIGVRNDDVRSAQWLVRADQRPTVEGSVVATRVGSTGQTVAVTPRPVAHAARPGDRGPSVAHTIADQPAVRWSGASLSLAVTITVVDPDLTHPDSPPAPDGEPVVLLVARGHKIAQERPLPAEVTVARTGLDDGWRFTVRAVLDLDLRSSVLPGGGRWMPQLRAVWVDREVLVPFPAPATAVAGALLSGRPIAIRSVGKALQIDQTLTTTAPVGALRIVDCTLRETVDGLVLRADLPDLHVAGDGTLAGQIMAGGPVGPATVECVEGRAALVAHLSPATGRAEIATVFGGPRTPSGLDLELAPNGTWALIPHHREAPFQRPDPADTEEPPQPVSVAKPAGLPRRAYRFLRRRLRKAR